MNLKTWIRHEDDIISHVVSRLEQWRKDGFKPAQIYFTAGLERTIAQMLEQERNQACRKGALFAAEHVASYKPMLKSGFPAEVALDQIEKTFRSEDWYRVLIGDTK